MTTTQRHQSVQRPRVRGLGARIVGYLPHRADEVRTIERLSTLGEGTMLRLLSFDAINSLRRIALRD